MTAISVIIPIYNSANYLENCLDSLANQDFFDVEFICVNDGSTDSSLEICKKYADKDSRFIIIDQKNKGPAKARNTGIEKSKGDYLCFVDSDDCLVAGSLSRLYNYASKGQYDIVVHSAETFGDYTGDTQWIKSVFKFDYHKCNNFSITDIFKYPGCRPFLWLHFVRSEIIKMNNLWINEKLTIGEDQAFEIAYFSKAHRVLFVPEVMYKYRIDHEGSIMAYCNKHKIEKMWQHVEMLYTV